MVSSYAAADFHAATAAAAACRYYSYAAADTAFAACFDMLFTCC